MRTERLCGTLLALACTAAIAGCAGGKVRSAVLGPEQAEVVSEQCSRPNPPRYESTWLPGVQEIQQLEQDLPALNALVPAGGGVQVGNAAAAGGYYRQYYGIVVHGRRLIYINAFVESMYKSTDWKHYAIVVCDGGAGAWGALYDPASRDFSGFAFNGRQG